MCVCVCVCVSVCVGLCVCVSSCLFMYVCLCRLKAKLKSIILQFHNFIRISCGAEGYNRQMVIIGESIIFI